MTKRHNNSFLDNESYGVRKDILTASYLAHVGHIGSALSVVDLLCVLYYKILGVTPKNCLTPNRNRFILSKGHAATALYSVLYRKNFITRKSMFSYCQNGSLFGVHPDLNPKIGIESTTGSLGQGLSIGVGIALGLKMGRIKKNTKLPRVYVLISDAELNEGSIWEAVMFASHHNLNHLHVLVDNNGNQALGKTKDIINLNPISEKFRAFGWNADTVDGHDRLQIFDKLNKANFSTKPSVLICNTTSGYKVSFMENKIDWHYLPIDLMQYKKALEDIRI